MSLTKFNAVAVATIGLLVALGSNASVWAQDRVARVGVLLPTMEEAARQRLYEPFRKSLAQLGWVEGKNVALYFRAAQGTSMQFDAAVAELIQLKVNIIYAESAPATRAAYAATRSIPIVGLDYTNDPVAAGYAQSYAVPGKNLTGYFLDAPQFAAKWLELLQAAIPKLSRVAVLWDPNPGTAHLHAVQAIAQRLGLNLEIVTVRAPAELTSALATLRGRPQALVILPSPMLLGQSARLGELSGKYRLPAIAFQARFAEDGVLRRTSFGVGPP